MPSDTGAPFEIPYSLKGDKPPSIEAATKPIAERIAELLDEIAPKQIVGLLRGRVSSTGGVNAGTGFTAEKTGTGVYKIKFTVEFSAQPVVAVTPETGTLPRYAENAEVGSPKKEAVIRVFEKEGGATDSAFGFLVVEP